MTFSLHDVDDVGLLCVRAATRWMRRSRTRLSDHDFDSLIAFLVEAVWRMSERYDPARSSSFKAIVVGRLENRCVDWLRADRGRTRWQFSSHTHEREIPRAISIDVVDSDWAGGQLGRNRRHFRDQVGVSVGAVDGDPQTGVGSDLFGGLLDDRDGEEAWDTALVRALARRLFRERGGAARVA